MSDRASRLPAALRTVGLAALTGLVAGAAPWEGADVSSRAGLALLLAAPWLVVLWAALVPAGEARRRRLLALLLLAAAAGLVGVTLLRGGG